MLETSNHFKQTGLIQKANGSVLVKIPNEQFLTVFLVLFLVLH